MVEVLTSMYAFSTEIESEKHAFFTDNSKNNKTYLLKNYIPQIYVAYSFSIAIFVSRLVQTR